jgi:type IV pilus assembly protein PilC
MASKDSSGAPKKVKRTARKKTTAASVSSTDNVLTEDEIILRDSGAHAGSSMSFLQRSNVRRSDVTVFLRQLIMLLEAGTPILKALKTLSKRGGTGSSRELIADIAKYVENGNPLWQAFDRHPRHFDTIFVNLIKASEASGTLVTVLRRVTEYREEQALLRKRVRGAMIYPVVLIIACFGVMLLITHLVVPAFQDMFMKAGLDIPEFTRYFITASDIFSVWWWVPLVAVIVLVLLYKGWYVRSPLRRMTADRLKLKIPVIGPIVHKNAIVEMTRTMSMLLRSGLSMMATLDLTRNAIHNRAVAQSLQHVRDSVEEGGGLEGPLRASSNVVPPVVTDMFVTGEESGRVDQVAEQIAEVYEEEVKIAVESLGEAIQPIFTLIIGGVVVVLFIALFIPLITMIEQLSGAGA